MTAEHMLSGQAAEVSQDRPVAPPQAEAALANPTPSPAWHQGRWGWTPEALHPLQRLQGPSFSGKQNFLDSVTAVPLMTETQIPASTWL